MKVCWFKVLVVLIVGAVLLWQHQQMQHLDRRHVAIERTLIHLQRTLDGAIEQADSLETDRYELDTRLRAVEQTSHPMVGH